MHGRLAEWLADWVSDIIVYWFGARKQTGRLAFLWGG